MKKRGIVNARSKELCHLLSDYDTELEAKVNLAMDAHADLQQDQDLPREGRPQRAEKNRHLHTA